MDYAAMGYRIRNARVSRGWTQDMLSDRVNVSTSFLGHIERGSRKASLETLVSIINALEVSADSILMDSLQFSPVNAVPRMNDKQVLMLREVIRAISDNVDGWDE